MENPKENKDKTNPEENKDLKNQKKETEKKKIPNWIWWTLGALALIAIIAFVLSRGSNDKKVAEKPKTEQQPGPGAQQPGPGAQQPGPGGQQPGPGAQQPGPGAQQPIAQIDLPPSNGEYNWLSVDQATLTKALTTTPDLKGEKVLLVYIIKGHPSGQDMVWIQTDPGGPVRNIFCEKKYTKL